LLLKAGFEMATLTDVVAFLIQQYPYRVDLSKARLTKLVYLADWHHAVNHGSQISGIKWHFDNFGPFVRDVIDTVTSHPEIFKVVETVNMFGNPKTKIDLISERIQISLSESAAKSVGFVIEKTSNLSWSNFIRLVYSTYPIASSPRYSDLDLPLLALEYSKQAQSVGPDES